VQVFRIGQRLCGKIEVGDKPSHLNMCYFHNFLINIYSKENMHYFLGNPCSFYIRVVCERFIGMGVKGSGHGLF
jgi:hypothetical protein